MEQKKKYEKPCVGVMDVQTNNVLCQSSSVYVAAWFWLEGDDSNGTLDYGGTL